VKTAAALGIVTALWALAVFTVLDASGYCNAGCGWIVGIRP